MLKKQKMNRPELENNLEHMKIAKENIYKQASMAAIAIVVTIVLVFAMSVAWYSNVIHTENLVFQVSSWDFDFEGLIEIGAEKQSIAPGDSGIVPLKLENEGNESVTVLVNVTKNTDEFEDYMQKRIYFYVDHSQKINDEIVDKVYINEKDSYAYTVLAANTLALNEEYHSDPYLKWEWVYDVVGYYVYGTMEEKTLVVEDYMRPVTYDYDKAVFDSDHELVSVEGGMTRKEFLEQLFKTDGYQGSTVPSAVNEYYPVVVDEATNTGIWLYLCDQAEIEANTAIDNQLAESAKKDQAESFFARLLLSGQQSKEEIAQVANAQELEEKLLAEDVDRVSLSGDITLSDTVTLSTGKKVVLDLNEYTLTMPSGGSAIEVKDGSSITVINGTMEGNGSGVGVKSIGAGAVLNHVVIENAERGVYVADDASSGLDSNIKIANCSFDVSSIGVMVRGNESTTGRKTYILIEKSTLTGGDYGISGNGSAGGVELEIIGSTIEGGYAGIYHPQGDSAMDITNSTVEGQVGMAVKAGIVNIEDTTVFGTGKKEEPSFESSGFSLTGDAIYIETNYNKDIVLNVGGTNTVVKSTNSKAIQVYEENASHVTVTVTGGSYSTDVVDYIPSGYAIKEEADGTYYVAEAPAVIEDTEE